MDKPLAMIENFEHLTAQQCVQMAYDHIHSTGKISRGSTGCIYSGSGCAASVFLKPEYHTRMDAEGSWEAVIFWEGTTQKDVDKDLIHNNFSVIKGLQFCHDSWSRADKKLHPKFMGYFDERVRALCERFDLAFPGEPPTAR